MLNSWEIEYIYADKYIRPRQSLSKKYMKIRMFPNSIDGILLADHEVHECRLKIKVKSSHKHSPSRYNIKTCLKSPELIYGLDAMITGLYSSITINK